MEKRLIKKIQWKVIRHKELTNGNVGLKLSHSEACRD
jgi:hypothetical protein